MSRHRQPKRRAGSRRAETKPRYGRMAAVGAAVVLTSTAVLGGIGLFPDEVKSMPADLAAGEPQPKPKAKPDDQEMAAADLPDEAADDPESTPSTEPIPPAADDERPDGGTPARNAKRSQALPDRSGKGRRVVYSESLQQVWLVTSGRKVARSYPVSGSIYDNLEPGTYEVYSRSAKAQGIDDSGTMRYFVRFTEGDEGAAIGFHDIPVLNGKPLQSLAALGTPRSHGCVRQKRADAIALWEFADIGTTVVVTA